MASYDQTVRALQLEAARLSFWHYCKQLHPKHYKDARPHLMRFCDEMQDFIESDEQVLILNAPPRHYKSFTATNLCDWVIGKWPMKKVMSGSYNETLSETFSKAVRNTIDTVKVDPNIVVFSDIFPGIRIKRGDGAVNRWALEGQHATYLATSPTGTATGFGADLMVIDDLIKSALEANNALVLDKHWDWFCFTGDTKVSTPNGDKKISDIRNGDKIYTYNHCQCIIEEGRVKKTQSKQAPIYRLRLNNGTEIEVTGNHQFYTNIGYKSVTEILHCLWGEVEPGQTVLFPALQEQSAGQETSDIEMPELRKGNQYRKSQSTKTVLFYGMPESVSVKELTTEICDVESDSGRPEIKISGMSEMPLNHKSACPPHRSRWTKQRTRQHDSSLPIVSYQLSQATRLPSDDLRTVYDIEVEVNHNFFANGILAHNCNTMLSRLEEGGKIIIVMTRWHSKDLAGRALEHFRQIGWKVRHITFKALQDDGTMLCDELLSLQSYIDKTKSMGADIAAANYQQEPIDIKGKLYTSFKTYTQLPMDDQKNVLFESIYSYTDTADSGSDYLCNLIWGVYRNEAYMLDVYYTKDGMEITEPETARRMTKLEVSHARVESNNGGSGFARNVQRHLRALKNFRTIVKWFHQSKNKRARILTNATWVMEHIYYPVNWRDRWPDYYDAMNTYQREGTNAHDDAPDATTGVAETMTKLGAA